ncbi:DUF4278 domain-containing protein [Stenomitos frigidus]|uniref:DUF4278 domain-containing protein n=1 Tax=Stenomitos frigidus ULC18 TaxID=2107698 RepID=A0A2T1ERI2_9CYAN|nr:DUF4278 domain-containing protein [Stenomitos frigidus]PSB35258.1 hypothetical protein C7B82_01295 [Stenomitos frigidus ULC18]
MQLIYRGQAFYYLPSFLLSASIKTGLSRTLFYRGQTYHCQLTVRKPSRLPKAINWRFAGVMAVPNQHLTPAH